MFAMTKFFVWLCFVTILSNTSAGDPCAVTKPKAICAEAKTRLVVHNYDKFISDNCIHLNSNDGRKHDTILVCEYNTGMMYIGATEDLSSKDALFYPPPDRVFKFKNPRLMKGLLDEDDDDN